MKYWSLLSGIALIFLIPACGDNSTGETIYVPKSGDVNVIVPSSVDSNGVPANNTIINTPVLSTQQPIQTASQTTTIPAGMNPEHGKPGHRCDIAVGAPLNSPAPQAQPVSTPTTTSKPGTSAISSENTTIVTSSKPVAAGMNPEHGKPGHRCDIAVGAPLDSKPAEVKPSVTQTTTNTDVPTTAPVTPLLPTTNPPTTPVVAGMNPEHGKPGHRCDIAVGAPLPKQ